MLRQLWNFFFVLISLLSALATMVMFDRDYFGKLGNESVFCVGILGVLVIIFLLMVLWQKVHLSHDARYAVVLPSINEAFSTIHAAVRNGEKQPAAELRHSLEEFVGSLAHIFTAITGTPCSSSIKLLAKKGLGESERIHVVTLVRDGQSKSRRAASKSTKSKDTNWLEDNSDFKYLLKNISSPKGRFYFCNRLPFLSNYSNFSFDHHGGEPDTSSIPFISSFLRWWRWPLPYKSTIVVPICPGIAEDRIADNLVGFLCVDSPRLGAFKKNYDTTVMTGVADGIYNAVKLYIEKIQKENNS